MLTLNKVTHSFPSICIASASGGLPVEVSLIAQLMPGSGDHLYAGVIARQQAHENFIDELDEPSTKLHDTDFAKGDLSALYSFAVGPNGHPFHQHAGQRLFTAISGSSGTQLRFSSVGNTKLQQYPQAFVDALQFVNIPADCLFTVRFGGETWHQFAPLKPGSGHPAFFALSCHINELGGIDSAAERADIIANKASIPSLTRLLPQNVLNLLQASPPDPRNVNTVTLTLNAAPDSLRHAMCKHLRSALGWLLGTWGGNHQVRGFLVSNKPLRAVALSTPAAGSLLLEQFKNQEHHHEDLFSITLTRTQLGAGDAPSLLAALLASFVRNPPRGITHLMHLRNALVRPWGLRTASLGCPVSSLLSDDKSHLFDGRFPVLAQAVSGTRAEVVLGADDKHLRFRSCVAVEIVDQQTLQITLGTRVQCKNSFGRLYMALIHRVHLSYVAPTMLEHAVAQMLPASVRGMQPGSALATAAQAECPA
jgi:hypothetical protein